MQINCSNIRDLPKPKYLTTTTQIQLHQSGLNCTIESFKLASEYDDTTLTEWALHIRRHYARDDQLASISTIQPTDQYLRELIIPDEERTRTGDFGEILVADIIEHNKGYIVPRYKQFDRDDKNMSGQGVDIVAYKLKTPLTPQTDDELLLIEVKSSRAENRVAQSLRKAKQDYRRNLTRRALAVDNIRRRATMLNDLITANEIRRFQDQNAADFQETNGYAIVVSIDDMQYHIDHHNTKFKENDEEPVYVVYRAQLGNLIDSIYERCTQ
jgi:hypothetical protein